MIRVAKSALAAVLLPLVLAGCWDLKDLQEVNYITAIGFDYRDDEFIVYTQMVDFASVAKMEAAAKEPNPVWVGIGRGKSLVQAIDDLYHSSQIQLFYGHINAIVIGETLFADAKKMRQFYEFQSRYYELRYTPWIFATQKPIDQLFIVPPLFKLAPAVTIMHQPMDVYRQRSLIQPLSVRKFNSDVYEPGHTTILPSLSTADVNWKKGEKYEPMLEFDGAYLVKDMKYRGRIEKKHLRGLPWVDPATRRVPLQLYSGKELQTALMMENPDVEIHPRIRNGKAEYTVDVKLSAIIAMALKPVSESKIEKQAEERIRKEIFEVFEEGLKHRADLLQLEQALYRKKNREWKRLKEQGRAEVSAESLKDVNVTVKVNRTGKIKLWNSLD